MRTCEGSGRLAKGGRAYSERTSLLQGRRSRVCQQADRGVHAEADGIRARAGTCSPGRRRVKIPSAKSLGRAGREQGRGVREP